MTGIDTKIPVAESFSNKSVEQTSQAVIVDFLRSKFTKMLVYLGILDIRI